MSADLVDRLRVMHGVASHRYICPTCSRERREAADEIERLRATVAVADNLLGGTKWQKDYADVIAGGDDE